MAACATSSHINALSSLLQRTHLPSSSIARTADPNDDLASFSSPLSSSFKTSTSSRRIEQDWHNFIAPKPRSQIQACPPFAHADHPSSAWANEYDHQYGGGAEDGGSLRGFSPADYAAIVEPNARWSPEVETAIEARRNTAASPALSASSYTSEVPTPEEADRICCQQRGLVTEECCSRNQEERREEEATSGRMDAHPLTLHAASEAEWDFERLFSRRKRWIDGRRSRSSYPPSARSATHTEEDNGDEQGYSTLAKRRSRSKSRSRLCEEVLPSVMERTVEAHATLRETAMSRLALVVRHLGGEEKMKR